MDRRGRALGLVIRHRAVRAVRRVAELQCARALRCVVGGNARAARLVGLATNRLILLACLLGGAVAAGAGRRH